MKLWMLFAALVSVAYIAECVRLGRAIGNFWASQIECGMVRR